MGGQIVHDDDVARAQGRRQHLLAPGSEDVAVRVAKALWEAGIYSPAVKAPSVPVGDARIRVVVTSMHSKADLDRLLGAISHAL